MTQVRCPSCGEPIPFDSEGEAFHDQAMDILCDEIVPRLNTLIEGQWEAPTLKKEIENYFFQFTLINKKSWEGY